MKPVETYFLSQEEPYSSILLSVRELIVASIPEVEETFSYKLPFYKLDSKPLMYLNVPKKKNYIDVAFIQGTLLEKRFPFLKNDAKRKQVRSLHIKHIEDIDYPLLVALLEEATTLLRNSKSVWVFKSEKSNQKK